MNRYFLLLIILLLGQSVFADGGMRGFEVTITFVLIALIALLCVIIFTALRFSSKPFKVSIPMNVSCAVLGSCTLLSLLSIGSTPDSGFQITCYVTMFVSMVLIFLNYRVGINN